MRVKTEVKYTLEASLLFIGTYFFLFILLRKYYYLTAFHFIQVCKSIALNLVSSTTHTGGFLILAIVIISGIVLTAKTVVSLIKTRLRVRTLLRYKTNKKFKKLEKSLKRHAFKHTKVEIVRSKNLVAITHGYFSPRIIISDSLIESLTEKELEAVLLHELHHVKNKHTIIYLISTLLKSSLFFLPLLDVFTDKMKFAFEAEADKAAVKIQKTDIYIKQALVKTLNFHSKPFSLVPNFSVDTLEHRINKINNYKNRSYVIKIRKKDVFTTLLSLVVLLSLFFYPSYGYAKNKKEKCVPLTCSIDCIGNDVFIQQ